MKILDHGFFERLKFVITRLGGLAEAAKITGYSTDQVAKWRDGKSRPAFQPLANLAEASGLSLDWLAFGQVTKAASSDQEKGEDGNVVFIPVLNVVGSAGNGQATDHVVVTNQLPFSRALLRQFGVKAEAAHFIRARGDSMEPAIADGAIVLIDGSVKRIRDDGIYALVVDGDVRIKRAQKAVNGLILRSDNTRYADELVTDAEQVRVEGKVFWTGSEV